MDMSRHKTYRKTAADLDNSEISQPTDKFKNLLEDSAREAYSRPWHRLERGLRLNRFRIFIEDIAPQFGMTQEERELFDLAVSLLEESLPIVIAHGYNDFRVRVHKGAITEIKELLEREDDE